MSAYRHKEAYCLMKYASQDGAIIEWIWNSRDGVTPFIVRSIDGTKELQHVDWQLDRCMPSYKPLSGERIFVDATEALLRPRVEAYVAKHWNNPMAAMQERYKHQQQAIEALIKAWNQPGAPLLIFERERRQSREEHVYGGRYA